MLYPAMHKSLAMPAAGAATLYLLLGTMAPAQANIVTPGLESPETVTVRPYIEEHKPISGPQFGLYAGAELVTLSRLVTYSDLNLANPGDRAELEKRVFQTANDVCTELFRRYGTSLSQSKRDCVTSATRNGMAMINQVYPTRG